MAKSSSSKKCYGSYKDDDSGIGMNYDYSSAADFNSSTMTSINSLPIVQSKLEPFPISGLIGKKRSHVRPLVKYTYDGIVERIRPVTMRNSENGDFIVCQTNRGSYVAHRTPVVPSWITKLVNEIEAQGK